MLDYTKHRYNHAMNKEDFFIKQFAKSKFIGDDGAVVGNWVYSNDAFFENVHFKRQWFSLEQIAYKAMIVNISDAIVMNADPKYALLTVAIPKELENSELKKLARGFQKAAQEYGIEIIGGDTIANAKLDISVTIISRAIKPIYRTGTKKGDLIAYTGQLGSVKKDLQSLFDGKKISKNSRFIKPVLRKDFFYEVSNYINSAMDISDGLCFELERLSKANKIGFDFKQKIPHEIGCSGEEYEIVFSFDPKNQKAIEKIAKKHNVNLTIVAKAQKGTYQCKCKKHHF